MSLHALAYNLCMDNKNTNVESVTNIENIGCSIVISTRNEPFDVCKMTFDSALQQDFDKNFIQIIVVDNSDKDHCDYTQWKEYVESYKSIYNDNCIFIHRDGTEGFKPRNLDIAMKSIKFDYVMFLDVDSTLPENAIKVGIQNFINNKNLGFVSFLIQSTNYNFNFITKAMSVFQNTIRYFNEFTGKYGYCNFQGHNAMWSKQAIDKIAPWEEYHRNEIMVTEDIAAGFRCYKAGFSSKSVFLKTGEWVPTSLKEFENMWLRWSFGGMQVMHKYINKIISSNKISFRVKLDMLYLLFKLVISGFPILAMLIVMFPINNIGVACVINATLFPLFVLCVWYYFYGEISGKFFSKISQIYTAMFLLSSFVFLCGIKAEVNYYLKRPQGWKPTAKKHLEDDDWATVFKNHAFKLSFSFVGLLVAIYSIIALYSDANFYVYLSSMIPSILLFANTILCVLVLGKSR
jgi:cellulose synthase/poly-beta-1,6-N-acetylglucosamine synthase-like glycosyltransferase